MLNIKDIFSILCLKFSFEFENNCLPSFLSFPLPQSLSLDFAWLRSLSRSLSCTISTDWPSTNHSLAPSFGHSLMWHRGRHGQREFHLFLAATKQLYEWFSPSVRLFNTPFSLGSVRPSVQHTFFTMFPSSYHHEIFKSYYHWQKWCPCKKSRSQSSKQILPYFGCFWTITQVLIYRWLRNDALSLKWCRRGALLFLKVIRQISRSHRTKTRQFWPKLDVSIL